MLQVWRVQQVAAILTLILLALNLSLQLYNYINWRGGILETPYIGVPIILLALGLVIWGFAIFWDLRMKMWREQMAVTMERNPYAKEKMYAKEIMLYGLTWLPVMDKLAKDDPEMRKSADAFKVWIRRAINEDPGTKAEWDSLLEYIKDYPDHIGNIDKK